MYRETSVGSCEATVLTYNTETKKWIPEGSGGGRAKVSLYKHNEKGTFRIIGRNIEDKKFVLNCNVTGKLAYHKATETFHQVSPVDGTGEKLFGASLGSLLLIASWIVSLSLSLFQWRGPSAVYGLNFSDPKQAASFGGLMKETIAMLQSGAPAPVRCTA